MKLMFAPIGVNNLCGRRGFSDAPRECDREVCTFFIFFRKVIDSEMRKTIN